MAKNPTKLLFLRASACGLRMIETYNRVRLSCVFYNQDRCRSQVLSRLRHVETQTWRESVETLFLRHHAALAGTYNRVAGWWVGHETPSFEPQAASALEGILLWSSRLLSHLLHEDPYDRPGHLDAAIKFALNHCPPMPTAVVTALLRTETRRFLDELPRITRQPGGRLNYAELIESICDDEVVAHLPNGWCELSVEDKIAAMGKDEHLEVDSQERLLNHPLPCPSWEPGTKTLRVGEMIVKVFRYGPTPYNQASILNAMKEAGWPE